MSQDIPITPIENIAVKMIPIAASPFVSTFCCIHDMIIAVISPAIVEPRKKPIVEYPKRTKAKKTPGSTACDRASPIRDIFRSTIKQPKMPHIKPTMELANKARIAHVSVVNIWNVSNK